MSKETAAFVCGLRELADWYEAHPDIEMPFDHEVLVYVYTREKLVECARALGIAAKVPRKTYFGVERRFGPISLRFFTNRENVCRKVVTGTELIPATPEREIEIVEWICDEPLLAELSHEDQVGS